MTTPTGTSVGYASPSPPPPGLRSNKLNMTLVIAEHDGSILAPITLNAITAAKKLGYDIAVLVDGKNASEMVEQVTKVDGVMLVLVAESKKENILESPGRVTAEVVAVQEQLKFTEITAGSPTSAIVVSDQDPVGNNSPSPAPTDEMAAIVRDARTLISNEQLAEHVNAIKEYCASAKALIGRSKDAIAEAERTAASDTPGNPTSTINAFTTLWKNIAAQLAGIKHAVGTIHEYEPEVNQLSDETVSLQPAISHLSNYASPHPTKR